jgi:hypothetical protein
MGGNGSGKIPEGSIVKLDGTIEAPDGSITNTQLFDFLNVDLDDYSDIQLTAEEAQRFANHVRRMKTGVSAFLPKLCPGPEKCLIHKRCPLTERWPIGRACPLEVGYIKEKTRSYVDSLDVKADNPYEMALINNLVELDVMEYRANIALADDSEDGSRLLRKDYHETKTGALVEMVGPHPLLEVKERIQRKRLQILESFTATRREEYKKAAALKKKDTTDISHQLSELRGAVKSLSKAGRTRSDFDSIVEDAETVASLDVEEVDWETTE